MPLQFIERRLRDPADGEWLWSTDAAGMRPGGWGSTKGNLWKASYHSTRMLAFLDTWIGGAVEAPGVGAGGGALAECRAGAGAAVGGGGTGGGRSPGGDSGSRGAGGSEGAGDSGGKRSLTCILARLFGKGAAGHSR